MSASYWQEKEAEEQVSATLMLLANMQQEIKDLRARVEALEEMVGQGEDEEPVTYMDGSPVL